MCVFVIIVVLLRDMSHLLNKIKFQIYIVQLLIIVVVTTNS